MATEKRPNFLVIVAVRFSFYHHICGFLCSTNRGRMTSDTATLGAMEARFALRTLISLPPRVCASRTSTPRLRARKCRARHPEDRLLTLYIHPLFSPTRAMLMTGTDHHIAGLGNLIEWTNISGQNDPEGVSTSQNTAPQRGKLDLCPLFRTRLLT